MVHRRVSVTIGIPAYNEEQNMLNLLQSIEEQLQPQHLNNNNIFSISEVIVSDDSSDNTPDIVAKFAQYSSIKVKVFHHKERRGAAAAWNEIFQHATGDIIVLYDADTIPHPSCTAYLVSAIDKRVGVGLCASNSQPVQSKGIAGRASIFISNWLRSVRLTGLSQYTVMGRALAIDSSVARNIEIPLDIIAIDLYLQCKVLEKRLQVVYNDNAVVYFKPANKMQDLASQVIRAVNGHNQIRDYLSKFKIDLPVGIAIIQAIKNAVTDPLGAVSVAIGYSVIPYYRSKLANVGSDSSIDSAKWHTAESSKIINYDELKTMKRFSDSGVSLT
jgi:glycosyltransferase involved in cell wall biosynthesis